MVAKYLESSAAFWAGDVWTVGDARFGYHDITWLKNTVTHVEGSLHHNLKSMAVVGVTRQRSVWTHTQRYYRRGVVFTFPKQEVSQSGYAF